MGFKDLCKFNEAMLAKQVWRLVHDKTSLFYKVFKAKYFPNCRVFEAKVKSGSFAWRSILYSRKLILMGAKWRVGDGTQIKIYEANWLPRESQGRVISSPVFALSPATVLALIDTLTYSWNSQIIDSTFLPFEAKLIKSIPLGIIKQPDLLYWPWSRDRSYSVSTEEQKVRPHLQTWIKLTGSGKNYGRPVYQENLSTSYGKRAQMHCPQRPACYGERLFQKAPTHSAKTRLKQFFILSGNATPSDKFGRRILDGWIVKKQLWDPFKIWWN